jgi:hypothetical protein
MSFRVSDGSKLFRVTQWRLAKSDNSLVWQDSDVGFFPGMQSGICGHLAGWHEVFTKAAFNEQIVVFRRDTAMGLYGIVVAKI